MPFWMNFDAWAVDAPTRAATKAAAARRRPTLRNGGVPAERRQRAPQALVELDLGCPTENLLGARDIGLADLWIVDRQCLEDDRARRPGRANDRLGELEQRHLSRVSDVDRQMLARLGEQNQAADEIVHEAEAAGLPAASEDRQRLLLERLADEGRD